MTDKTFTAITLSMMMLIVISCSAVFFTWPTSSEDENFIAVMSDRGYRINQVITPRFKDFRK